MSKPPPTDVANEGLDRALSLARTPAVPADLAARIVARVTQLPQPAPQEKPIPPARPERPRRNRVLAAALGAILVVGGAALSGLWPAGNSETTDPPVLAASFGKSEQPDLAVDNAGNLARSEPKTDLRASVRKIEENAAARDAVAPDRMPEPTPPIPAPSGESVVPIAPDEGTVPQGDIELAEQALEPSSGETPSAVEVAAGPVGPTSSNGNGANSGAANSPVPGPPVPQGLGITGSSPAAPAPAIKSGPAGRRPPPSRR